ncbi:MAG: hypothetical protein ACI8RZ_002065 [Myxococcota bacterium]|jgi:hypothetical protein
MRIPAALILFSIGCTGDNSLLKVEEEPAVIITMPIDGAEFAEGETIFFEGIVDDDDDPEQLQVSWIDSATSSALEEDSYVEADGTVQLYTSALEPGERTIVLRVIDTDNNAEEATVSINVIDVPDKPSITVLHPDLKGVEKGLDGSSFIFMVEIYDYQDPAEDVVVELLANPYGLVCTMSPDGNGIAQCPGTLPLGVYTLTYTATDTDDNATVANAPFSVVGPGDYDADGDGYTPNGGDCNDSSVTIYPGADEICDGLDNDCIEATAIDVGTDCYDDDGDGFCESPPCVNTSETLADCDDTDPAAYPDPSIPEVVNGADDDCDGEIDEGTVVYDDDSDGYCEEPPCINVSSTEEDCDDTNPDVNPGEDEVCSDGVDNNCNGQSNEEDALGCDDFFYDGDGDTYGISGSQECWCDEGSYPYTGLDVDDCYDASANAHPGQTSYFEVDRGDGSYDYNCDGSEQELLTGVTTGCSWDFEPFSCGIDATGWISSEPNCGDSGVYSDDCSGNYDTLCMAICLITGSYSSCTSCWTCDADETTTTQACL